MKFTDIAVTLATAGSLVSAQHHHNHRHVHAKRAPAGDVVYVYEFDGAPIDTQKVCEGIASGSLKWADGQAPEGVCNTASSSAAPTPSVAPAEFLELSSSSTSSPTPTSTSTSSSSVYTPPATSSSSTPVSSQTPTPSPSSSSSGAKGLEADFPDGELDCSEFPSDYGAVALDYLGLGGWSGIQYVSLVGEVVSDIITAVTGDHCTEGSMCSYACPAGYQKSQWPTTQGSTGQSVGGLQCKGGKLYLTNPSLSNKICIPGEGKINVQNTLGDQIAICRTDYPGTESETIPVSVLANELQPLTCPNGETYFHWQGKDTSAQYYVNPKGVSAEEACQWGDGSKPIGNWAPINIGVGQKGGYWLSIFQNKPTTNQKLDYNIRIEGDNLSGACKYENGMFYDLNGSNEDGCTVQALDGQATFVTY
ncbi:SUN domain protein (Uth1), putative [Paecilomyces variotii No. 5]|uniref:SUN domain protein (Uth1), putative n=1 Tax=Byssochlamys spectabilis (strain No. 5 / NBRC 109023) TaxID=1356009 RepID=V5I2T5_BYSSN|nr:SUN domain protein (Uth1), putative [Paecilomyces variotii No. 5]